MLQQEKKCMVLELYHYQEIKGLNAMEDFSYNTKIAILRVLTEIINADNVVHEKEIEYIEELVKQFSLDESYKTKMNNIVTLQALNTLSQLNPQQKEQIAVMMGKMIVIDKDINYNEVKLYNTICESCFINKDFRVEDYPEYSLSGPFINPEDI